MVSFPFVPLTSFVILVFPGKRGNSFARGQREDGIWGEIDSGDGRTLTPMAEWGVFFGKIRDLPYFLLRRQEAILRNITL
jgi:hypothetical protein